ncbi:serine hydrolase domain-containing protein [Kribbella speibonae]|uniref:Class A beta-lactamase-related serine hydrolase n=1 Tax=Kribbella speibonae TaxID=1572660 RepID=A0A4R0IXB7_9ACTN|nr:serine hydrolase domain-containing protein [Kribbella speibonae]TCC38039.1 class A beta-lactamase-related serine hydrolase [Kribbella speibonae]
MRWSAAALLVIALVGCSGGGDVPVPSPQTPAQTGFPAEGTQTLDPARAKTLQDVLAKTVAFPDSPSGSRGITAAVVTDHWTWSGAAGADIRGTPLRADTSMAVASITKTFVAAEVMLLASQGKLNLDLPLAHYVQHKLTANGATVRQHLSMTAGVPDFSPYDISQLDQAVAAAPSRHWTLAETLNYYAPTIKEPDGTFSYSSPSYALLGLLIEKVAGQPLATVLRRDLATPAGLRRAAFQDAEKPQPPVANDDNEVCGAPDGYVPCRAFASSVAAFGGLAADAPTVARWGYELYGGRLLPADLVRQMTAGDGEYGLGTMRFTRLFGLGDAYGHGGDMPDHTSLLVVVPEKKISIAVILADGGRHIDRTMSDLTKALEPLLS